MSEEVEFESRVKGGLPVLVTCRILPAEPDVGCAESAEIEGIFWLSGKPISDRVWRSIPDKDFTRIEDEAIMHAEGVAVRRFWERMDYLRDQRKDRQLEERAA